MEVSMALTREEHILVEGCRKGDEKAWMALYKAYASDIGLFLRGMLRYSTEIDDLVQKVFLQFLSSLERFRGDASVRTWLHRIARHVALHEIRSSSRRSHYVRDYAASVDRESPDPQEQSLARNRLSLIYRVLDDVDASFREVWILRELEGFSVTEAAAVLEVPEATVRTRHYRARQRIFAALDALESQDEDRLTGAPVRLKLLKSEGGPS
jgi:RNA polymerase sigma-70 factor (ECF subfamily)